MGAEFVVFCPDLLDYKTRIGVLQKMKNIKIISKRKTIVVNISTIFYVLMSGKNAEIHVSGGHVYKTRMSLQALEEQLGEEFIKLHRGCLVSARAIYDITDTVNLINGKRLLYTIRKKKTIMEQMYLKQQNIISNFPKEGIPSTLEEYRQHYRCFDDLPIAFTDIEMVFDKERHAVDWIFRYANEPLAKLEKLSLEQLTGSSFGSLFSNMDSKWLRCYEQSALYGDVQELMDYSPEIDTYLKVICFPTFKGHCGCFLFDLSKLKFNKSSNDVEKTLAMYLSRIWDVMHQHPIE